MYKFLKACLVRDQNLSCQRFGSQKVGKKLPKIWQIKCEKLASFNSQPNISQNHDLPNPWLGKFWK
jgi:hypothetical protein